MLNAQPNLDLTRTSQFSVHLLPDISLNSNVSKEQRVKIQDAALRQAQGRDAGCRNYISNCGLRNADLKTRNQERLSNLKLGT